MGIMLKKSFVATTLLLSLTATAYAADQAAAPASPMVEGEKAFMNELKGAIPADRVVTVDALLSKAQEIQAGKSKAVILDIRTHDEFDCGHILGASNIDSGHAYTMPTKFTDPETEIYVFCRTKHRATYFTAMLYKYGYKNVYMVDGGIAAWSEKGYPLVNEYLGEIKVVKYDKKLKEEFTVREGH
jgi:rhodanese-related sulfurtransferase